MNLDEHIESLIKRRNALDAIIAAHENTEFAFEAIADYCDDPESISSPELIRNFDIFFNGGEPEITVAAEKIYLLKGREFGIPFCEMNELCAKHFCDPQNCTDMNHDDDGEIYIKA